MDQVTRTFKYTINAILHAKFRNFLKKNIWKYAIVSLMLTFGFSMISRNSKLSHVNTFIAIFACVIFLSVMVMIISSYFIFLKKRLENMVVTFRENEIEVFWSFKDKNEIKSWDWIRSIEETSVLYYLDLDVFPRNVIMVSKKSLSSEESDLLKLWFTSKGKLR